jgi:hypothetical protein
MSHAQIITTLADLGIQVSPFMHYWTLDELLRYVAHHVCLIPPIHL